MNGVIISRTFLPTAKAPCPNGIGRIERPLRKEMSKSICPCFQKTQVDFQC